MGAEPAPPIADPGSTHRPAADELARIIADPLNGLQSVLRPSFFGSFDYLWVRNEAPFVYPIAAMYQRLFQEDDIAQFNTQEHAPDPPVASVASVSFHPFLTLDRDEIQDLSEERGAGAVAHDGAWVGRRDRWTAPI